MSDFPGLRFSADGLIPAIAQDADSHEVLMLAYMNQEALRLTQTTGEAHFWSRSRQQLWHKGATSGHRLHVEQIAVDCEANSLLLSVRLAGSGACHAGYRSCFYRTLQPDGSFTIIAEPTFDPFTTYDVAAAARLERDLRDVYACYLRLRDEDHTATSATSRLLRDPTTTADFFLARAREEVAELQGVLAGTHHHQGGTADVVLEASQVTYWLCLAAALLGHTYDQWQPHTILLAAWQGERPALSTDAAESLLWSLGSALLSARLHPSIPIAADLASMRERLRPLK